MIISDILKRLPPFGDKEKSVEDVLVSYGSWIVSDSEAKQYLASENIDEIDMLIRAILKANKHFQTGQIAECYKMIYDIIFSSSYTYSIVRTHQVDVENFFYRMRQCDNEYLFSKEELFHIPFQERRRTSNQRFSLTGYPCLYLGKSIYVCWEELNRPKFDNANIVGLKTLRPIHLLDLRMPTEIKNVTDFYRIPLIIASSVKVQNSELPFKPEYIISQAILHAIISHNNTDYAPNNLNGIIYYSSTINNRQRLFDDMRLFENIVVPTINNTKDPHAEKIYRDGFCPILCNTFEITNPLSFNIFQLQKDVKTVFVHERLTVNETLYVRTQMGALEEHIKTLDTHKIEPNRFFRSRLKQLERY